MSRGKRKKAGGLSGRLTLFVAVAFIVGVAALLLLSYLQSPRGNVVLLDLGFADRFEPVQDAVDAALGAALRDLGLDKALREKTTPVAVGGRAFHRRDWTLAVAGHESLTRINIALAAAVESAGGVVRSSAETSPGILTFEAGSRKYPTHTITLSLAGGSSRGDQEPASPAGGEATAALRRPRVAIVIDDFGYSRDATAEEFLGAGIRLTVSVIPELPFTAWAIRRAAETGKEAILHLPMEAEAFTSDVAAVLTSMTDAEIESLVEKYIAETPGITGVNNHLGSVATQDTRAMVAVMRVLQPRRLYFLDSLTSNKSVAYTAAKSLGIKAARNDLFVDADTEDPSVVGARLDRLLEIATARGQAIGIGHPKPWTWTAVLAFSQRAEAAGAELVFLADLVD
jgi:polysaccharide deacetylase 2 family uncharacterized protein YibQ